MHVAYHNTNPYSFRPGKVRYKYTVSTVPGKQTAKVERVVFQNEFLRQKAATHADRLIINEHGIFIKIPGACRH